MARRTRRARIFVMAVAVASVLSSLTADQAFAAGPQPPPAGQAPPGVSVGNGDVAVGAFAEPGSIIDAILAVLNVLGVKGAQVALPPNGILPAANVAVSATGSVTAGATVSSCPADKVCFWDKPNFTGQKVVMGSPYTESGGKGCANLPAGFHPASVMTHLRNDRQVARRPNVIGGTVEYHVGLHLLRCNDDLPTPDVDLSPEDSRPTLNPRPGVVSYADYVVLADSGGGCDEFC